MDVGWMLARCRRDVGGVLARCGWVVGRVKARVWVGITRIIYSLVNLVEIQFTN